MSHGSTGLKVEAGPFIPLNDPAIARTLPTGTVAQASPPFALLDVISANAACMSTAGVFLSNIA
jgi:hypothetical protein